MGNILSFLKGVGVWADKEIICDIFFEDIKIIFTFDKDCIPEGYSYDIIYLSNKRPVFKEREECLEYLKKMYIDNLRLRNKMALDDEIDKINKITI